MLPEYASSAGYEDVIHFAVLASQKFDDYGREYVGAIWKNRPGRTCIIIIHCSE